MAAKVIFPFVILFQGVSVLGTLINPQHPAGMSTVQVHCLANNKPIQIRDPFDHRLIKDSKFIAMEWYQLAPPSNMDEGVKETLLIQFLSSKTNIFKEKFSVFDSWGLQINSVGLQDSATYKAKLVHLGEGRDWSVDIVVATPPVLGSEKLSVSRIKNTDGQSVTLSCGHLGSLGSPPVSLFWKKEDGTVLPGEFKDGYIKLTIPSEEDAGKYLCHLNMSSVAAKCILDADTQRFMEVFSSSSSPESADVTGIVIGAVVGVLFVLVIIAVVVFIKMRRQPTSETYNAREQEKRRDAELGKVNGVSLLKDGDPHKKSHGPIYKGVVSADSFTISKASEGSSDLIFKKINPQTTSYKNTECLNGEKSNLNGHRSQPQQTSARVVKQEGDKAKQQITNDKKNGKLETKVHKGKAEKPQEIQPRSALKHKNGTANNGTVANGTTNNGTVANGTTNNGTVGNGIVLSHGTLV